MKTSRLVSASGLALSLAALATTALVPRAMGVHARYGMGMAVRALATGTGILAILGGALLIAPSPGRASNSIGVALLSALGPVCLALSAAFGWARADGVAFLPSWTAYASEPAVIVFLVAGLSSARLFHVPGQGTSSGVARPFALTGLVIAVVTVGAYSLARWLLQATEPRLAVAFLGVLISAQFFLTASLVGLRGRPQSVWDRSLCAVSAVAVLAACVLVAAMDG